MSSSTNDLLLLEQAKLFLPKYLTPEDKDQLLSEIRAFPQVKNFYLGEKRDDEYLQGDGWNGLIAINFDTLEKKDVNGVILSNSCDIDPQNPSPRDRMILFCPLVRLSKYVELLANAGKSTGQIQDTLVALKRQEVTYAFYLPECAGVIPESIIVLDDIHRHPLRHFMAQKSSKLFALGQFAFYLLLVKVSIHFSRFQENIRRYS